MSSLTSFQVLSDQQSGDYLLVFFEARRIAINTIRAQSPRPKLTVTSPIEIKVIKLFLGLRGQ